MCGITGIFDLNKKFVDQTVLEKMTDTLSLRGPDDRGVYVDQNLGLGHTRLSILDLSSAGRQPMSNLQKDVWVVFNGEIYNFKEIKKELEQKGYKFKSNSDTEVLISSYQEWGIGAVEKFRGMFAFALWDKKIKKLFLVRDRAGVKPLYYFFKNNILLFGSELKSFHKNPRFQKELNFSALAEFLQFGYILAPATIFQNTFKVMPGHYLEISEGSEIKEIKYWDIADFYLKEPLTNSEEEIEEELKNVLEESFQYRMVSDVPVGVFLSGGIDSSLVAALLCKNSKQQLKTFTIGFHESEFNEAPYARKIAEYLKTDHSELYCSAKDALEIIPKFPEIYDEPFGDSSGIPTYLLSKFARQKVKVALSADAGDELFCGYSKYEALNNYYKLVQKVPGFVLNPAIGCLSLFSTEFIAATYKVLSPALPKYTNVSGKIHKLKNMLRYKNKDLRGIFENSCSYWTKNQLKKLITLSFKNLENGFYEFDRLEKIPLISQMQAIDYKTYLTDDIFAKTDRATMFAGLEAREPLADHKLSEFAARIPLNLKHQNGQSKYILRKILYKLLPKELLERPKQGFEIPVDSWLKNELKGMLYEYLSENTLKSQGIFDYKYINKNLNYYLNGKPDSAYKFWFLLVFQMWRKKWMS